jgi:hypothetical protein
MMNSDNGFKETLDREMGDMRLDPQMVGRAVAAGRARQRRVRMATTGGFFTVAAASALLVLHFFNQVPGFPPPYSAQPAGMAAGQAETDAPEALQPSPDTTQIPTADPTPFPAETVENGQHIQKTFADDAGNELRIDAVIPGYDNLSFPSAAISPKKFSQEQAEAIITALVGDSLFYDPYVMTIGQVNDRIAFYTQRMNEADEKLKDGYLKIIHNLEAELKDAVPDDAIPPASRVFKKVTAKGVAPKESITGKFKRDDQTFSLFIDTDDSGEQSAVSLMAVGGKIYSIIARAADATPEQDPGIPYEQAEAQAVKLAEDMGTGLTLADSFLGRDDDPEAEESAKYAYAFEFTRAVNGVQTQYDKSYLSAPGTEEENSQPGAKEPWPYELLTITINGQGVHDLEWHGPSKVDAVLGENVSMLPFEDVLAQVEKKFFEKNRSVTMFRNGTMNGEKVKVVVNVGRITLGLARVQSGSKYTLTPVWDFYGSVEYLSLDGRTLAGSKSDEGADFQQKLVSQLTVNATDGSVIDRMLGY